MAVVEIGESFGRSELGNQSIGWIATVPTRPTAPIPATEGQWRARDWKFCLFCFCCFHFLFSRSLTSLTVVTGTSVWML